VLQPQPQPPLLVLQPVLQPLPQPPQPKMSMIRMIQIQQLLLVPQSIIMFLSPRLKNSAPDARWDFKGAAISSAPCALPFGIYYVGGAKGVTAI